MLLCRNIFVESFSLESGHSWQRKTFVEAEDHQERCLQIHDFEEESFKDGSFRCVLVSVLLTFLPCPVNSSLYWESLWTTVDNFSALAKKQRIYY